MTLDEAEILLQDAIEVLRKNGFEIWTEHDEININDGFSNEQTTIFV